MSLFVSLFGCWSTLLRARPATREYVCLLGAGGWGRLGLSHLWHFPSHPRSRPPLATRKIEIDGYEPGFAENLPRRLGLSWGLSVGWGRPPPLFWVLLRLSLLLPSLLSL